MVKLPVNPTISFEMKLSEWKELNNLIERDKAVAIAKCGGLHIGYECPACGESIANHATDNFCRFCGQRLDLENVRLM